MDTLRGLSSLPSSPYLLLIGAPEAGRLDEGTLTVAPGVTYRVAAVAAGKQADHTVYVPDNVPSRW